MYDIISLVPFDLVFDTDFGIIKFVQFSDYGKNLEPILNRVYWFRSHEYDSMICKLLSERKNPNPLSIMIDDTYLSHFSIANLTETFLKEYGADYIYKLSKKTALFDMIAVSSANMSEVVKFNILCENQAQKQFVNENFKEISNSFSIPTILKSELKSLDNYGSIYVKNIYDLHGASKYVQGKNIIIINYPFNMEEDGFTPLVSELSELIGLNKIFTMDLYDLGEFKKEGEE